MVCSRKWSFVVNPAQLDLQVLLGVLSLFPGVTLTLWFLEASLTISAYCIYRQEMTSSPVSQRKERPPFMKLVNFSLSSVSFSPLPPHHVVLEENAFISPPWWPKPLNHWDADLSQLIWSCDTIISMLSRAFIYFLSPSLASKKLSSSP